jgi:hypothetical protein
MGKVDYKKGNFFSFIWQHHVPLAIFHHYESNLMFFNPNETCFVINFLLVE